MYKHLPITLIEIVAAVLIRPLPSSEYNAFLSDQQRSGGSLRILAMQDTIVMNTCLRSVLLYRLRKSMFALALMPILVFGLYHYIGA